MSEELYFADIHVHSSLKAFYSGYPKPQKNIWESIEHKLGKSNPAKFVYNNSKGIAKYSQSNFDELKKGKVRVATVSLYPIEKGFLEIRNIPKVVTNQNARDEMTQVITGYDLESVKYLRKHVGYFEELQAEYAYVFNQQGKSPDGTSKYKLVNNYGELNSVLKANDQDLAIILSIEGGHVFFNNKMLSEKLSPEEMKKELVENIGSVKSWEVPPLTVNLCHHFYNGLAGHSKSLVRIIGNNLFNQVKGLETGYTELGIKATKELLSRNNGKRVLIDTKHMSLAARKEYYKWIRSYNYISNSDKIPVICSHTGVNGYKTMSGSLRTPDGLKKLTDYHFCKWSINLSDEEISIIHESGGLIGLMLEKNKLGGGLFFKENIDGVTNPDAIKDAYSRIFLDNAFQVVKAVGNASGWNSICLGSDYDGAISHVDLYDKCSTMPELYQNLVEFLNRTRYQQQLWYGYKPEEIIRKIMIDNVMEFYSKHFV